MLKRTLVCALLVMGLMVGTAQAGPIFGSFTVDIYAGSGLGNQNGLQNKALPSNTLLTFLQTVNWDGYIDFSMPQPQGTPNTISDFFGSGTGSVTGLTVGANTMSVGNFQWTTMFVFHGSTGSAISGTIGHDDGISLWQNGLRTPEGDADPTSLDYTDYALNAGTFDLYYAAANGLPEYLVMDVTSVPDGGATLALLGCALVGLGALRRKFGA